MGPGGLTMPGRPALPPLAVDCGRCDHQFLTRAGHHVTIRCPRCKLGIRVKRPAATPFVPVPVPQAEPVAPMAPVAAARPASVVQDDLDARDYGLDLGLDPRAGCCQIIACRGITGQPLAEPEPCPGAGSATIGLDYRGRPIRVCERHGRALGALQAA
jgi:hypothetical protein